MSQRKMMIGILVVAAAVFVWQYPTIDYQYDYLTCLWRSADHYPNIANLKNAPDRETYDATSRLQCKGFESKLRFETAETADKQTEWGLKAVVAYSSLVEAYQLDTYRAERAMIYAGLGQYNRSLADYNYLLTNDPDNYWMYENRAKLYLQMDQPAKAVRDYQTILVEARNDTEISPAYLDRIAAELAKLEKIEG